MTDKLWTAEPPGMSAQYFIARRPIPGIVWEVYPSPRYLHKGQQPWANGIPCEALRSILPVQAPPAPTEDNTKR